VKHPSLVFDTGALIALERADGRVRALLRRADELEIPIDIPAGVVAQAWRGGRQARITRLLKAERVTVVPLDDLDARAVGVLAGRSGHSDVIDVHVVVVARRAGAVVLTSDPDDIRAVDPGLRVEQV